MNLRFGYLLKNAIPTNKSFMSHQDYTRLRPKKMALMSARVIFAVPAE
jgi:hypothetical protein